MNRQSLIGFFLIYAVAMVWFTTVYRPYLERQNAEALREAMKKRRMTASDVIRGGIGAAAWLGRDKAGAGEPVAVAPENGGGAGGGDQANERLEKEYAAARGKQFTLRNEWLHTEWAADGAGMSAIQVMRDIEGEKVLDRKGEEEFYLMPPALTEKEPALALRKLAAGGVDLATQPWRVTGHVENERIQFDRYLGDDLWVSKVVRISDRPEDAYFVWLDVIVENRGAEKKQFGYDMLTFPGLVEESTERGGGVHGHVCQRNVGGGGRTIEDMSTRMPNDDPLIASRTTTDELEEVAFYGIAVKYFATIAVPLAETVTDVPPVADPSFDVAALPPAPDGAGSFGQGFLTTAKIVDTYDPIRQKAAEANGKSGAEATEAATGQQLAARATVADFDVPPGRRVVHRYVLYLGPKDDRVLSDYARLGLDQVLYMGMFGSLSSFFLAFLRGLQAIIGSYGIAIIILTFFVRAAIHPLSRMTQKSTQAMQKLQPEMTKIREKYKDKSTSDARQKMQLEIMDLYKQHGMSPFSGCLPFMTIFIQLPVFIGLYNGLGYVFELRQKGFLYIDDLSTPDALFQLPFMLPFYETYDFNLLPLLMGVIMIVQQSLTPKPTDPQQAQMMKTMRFVFFLFPLLFYTVPAGLVLYFLTSSLVGIAESQWIKRRLKQQEEAGPEPAPAPLQLGKKK